MENKNNKLVQALACDYQKIYAVCCNALCGEHLHMYSSGQNLKNRFINTNSLCLEDNGDVCIRIDDTTKRTSINYYSNRCVTFSSRKFNKQKIRLDELNNNKKKIIIKESKKNTEEEKITEIIKLKKPIPNVLIVNFD